MIGSGVITLLVSILSAIVGFLALMLALNGFMGQERAVNTSIATYAVLGILVIVAVTVMSVFTASFLQRKFDWGAVVSVITSGLGFAAVGVVMHIVTIIIAAIVADVMRTTK